MLPHHNLHPSTLNHPYTFLSTGTSFAVDGPKFDLYQKVTHFMKRQSACTAAQDDNLRARAVRFLMALYQKRLASSTYAMRRSLENRAKRLENGLKSAQDLAQQAPPDLPGWEEVEEEVLPSSQVERVLRNTMQASWVTPPWRSVSSETWTKPISEPSARPHSSRAKPRPA